MTRPEYSVSTSWSGPNTRYEAGDRILTPPSRLSRTASNVKIFNALTAQLNDFKLDILIGQLICYIDYFFQLDWGIIALAAFKFDGWLWRSWFSLTGKGGREFCHLPRTNIMTQPEYSVPKSWPDPELGVPTRRGQSIINKQELGGGRTWMMPTPSEL